MTAPAPVLATILIPAWNEATVIARLLRQLAPAHAQFRVIVIANACTDATASVARHANPHALVLETAMAGKAKAMNLGYKSVVPGLPVVCLDADLSVTPDDIRSLIAPLQEGRAHAACGRMLPDISRSTWAVRAFYQAWALNPYFAQGKFGGLFALSATGAQRLFPLPPVTADDEWVRRAFAPADRAYAPDCRFAARAPRDLTTLIGLRRRALRGARAVRAVLGQAGAEGSATAMLSQAAWRPALWPAMAVYVAVMALVRAQLFAEPANRAPQWERDTGNRLPKVPLK